MSDDDTRPSADDVRARLLATFPGDDVTVRDDSHLHAGHAGSTSGAGHYSARIVSSRFQGLSTVARHRLVYDSLRDWMPNRIHALSIDAQLPVVPPA